MNYSQENKKKEKINNLINKKNITKINKKKNLNSSFSDSKTNISLDENSESLKKRKIFNNEGKKKNEYSERMNTFKNIFNNEREIPKNKVINNKLKIINIQPNKMELRNKSIKRKKKKNLISESKDLNEKMEKGIIKNEETCLESFIDNVIRNAKENHEEEKKFVGSNDIMINKTLNIENEKKKKINKKKEMKDKNDEGCLNVNDKIIEIFPETDMNYKNVTTNSLNNKECINENSAINLSDYINNEVDKCKNEKEDENGKAEDIEVEKRVKNISKINKSFYTESECSYLEKMNKTKLGFKNDCFCYCRKGKQYNNDDDINNYYNNNIDSAENKKENGGNELKNIDWLIYTIRYMDYRRLRRRFNGIRKPISKKIVFIITIFCLILISWKYFKTSYENNKFTISVEFQTTFLFFVEAIAAVIGIIIFAKFQTRLSLHWPIYASYIFIICASVILIFFEKDKPAKNSRGEHILIVYGIVQLSLIIIVKIIIFIGPLLAIYGFFCPCTEHCRILKKKMSTNKLNITVSRYNDFAGMCGNNFCCFCLCIYRSFYRIINCFYKKCSNLRFKMTKDKIKEAPFSHQLRYKGKTDIYGRPHGYGEWIEDHSYGEKLRGFWFHGYPVGPFISQEVGSGSLFVNTRVGFAACVGKDWSDVRYGVSCTECSISGHFFNDFPLTYFFNPKIEKEANGRLPTNRYDLIVKDILKENYEDILSYDLKWCFNMLKVNSGSTTEYCSNNCMISLDHVTMSLKVHNYKRLSSIKRRNNILDEINVKLVHVPKVKKNKKIHKRDKTNKYDHILKKQENDEFFYINQNKLHKNIRRLSSTNFPEINDSLQGSIHSYYTKKCSEKLLDSIDDEIYLYKVNKQLNSTEMHKSPYFYDYNEKSSHEDRNLKKKENKNFLSYYSSEWNINFCDMIKCSDTSSYKKKKINCNNFGKRKLNDSNHLKKICANNNSCDKNKYDIKICINNKNKYNEKERHSIYNDYKKDQNYKIKENSNIKEFFLKKDSSLFSSHVYENKIKNISSASEREGFVINIKGFDKMNKNNNLDEKVKIKNNFFSDYKNVSISQKGPVEKKEKSVFFSHSEYNTFMSNDKEFFYDDLLCSKFQTQDLLGTKKHGNIDKKKSNKEIKTEEEEHKEMKTFFQQKIESDYCGKSKKERRNKYFFKIDDNHKNKEKSQSRTKNRSKENISYREKYPEYEIDSNKEKINNENIELYFFKNEELALDNEGKFHKETTKDEKLSENKNLFFSDIFKSFINSSIQRNSKKRASVNSCEMEGIQKSNKQKKKTLRSYKFLSDVKKNRRDSFNKTTKKVNMNRIKNFKQKGLVKKNVKQTKKNSIYITSNHKKFDKILRLKYSKKNKNERILSSLGKKMKSLNEPFDNFNGPNLSPNLNRNKTIAQVFAEEDEWENYRHQHKEKIVIDGWQSLSLKRNLNFMPDEIVIYIHGYNVKLHHGCSQLAHLISFSKLPSYIQPFVFHWEGAMWGPFSALSYPVARKRSEMSILGRSFKKFIEDLINLGIKNVHLISHSCGSRLFFNGFSYCVEDNLFYNVLKNEQSKIKKDDNQKKRWGIENNDYDDNSNISNDEHSDTNTFIHNTKNSKKKKQIIVKTIILLNPDYPLDKFLEKDFFLLRTHCNHIVMYGDTRDQALTYSETWNREKCLGKRIFKLKLPLYKIHNYEDYLNLNTARNKLLTENYEEKYMMCDSVLFPHSTYTEAKIKEKQKQKEGEEEEKENNNDEQKESGEEEKLNASNKMLQINKTNLNSSTYDYNEDVSFISEEISHNYLNETFLKTVEFSDTSLKAFKSKKKFKLSNAFKQIKRKWLFKKKKTNIYFNENTSNRPYSLKMKKRPSKIPNQIFMKTDTVYISFDKYAWLDMDVIDTTFVETNVDFLKHSFYQVKREIIDDIREVLISNIRAHERVSRLDRRRGNVFVLRVAPAGVGSLHR
ncbi:conserved Plasmodium protein, unknown function [Plasmodium relictum]|uniref:Uncharacterized protein n=1 Tax=Plasmodium relictum TaxID=85471 RepID=A0A1J1H772_PLARL|nr:conserved Plasmodium protein, unknown function [Plasmodium relictum]CRH00760.1 conserved Plasmodium protein, unknown function [Plasmodium relictum]